MLPFAECVENLQSDALWDTHQHALLYSQAIARRREPLMCGEVGGLSGLDAARFLFLSVVE